MTPVITITTAADKKLIISFKRTTIRFSCRHLFTAALVVAFSGVALVSQAAYAGAETIDIKEKIKVARRTNFIFKIFIFLNLFSVKLYHDYAVRATSCNRLITDC